MKFRLITLTILFLSLVIRLLEITKYPPSPYWEEAALAYDSYSVLQTLHDHHGNFLPIVAFESFGDWKPSLYFYVIIPFIKIFGLNTFAIRLPSAIAGVFIVWGIGELVKFFINEEDKKRQYLYQLIAMFLAAINPWAIQFSRAAWEANLATALILWGVIFLISALRQNKLRLFLTSAFLLLSSIYTYHSARIISPLLAVSIVLIFLSGIKNKLAYLKPLLISGLMVFILLLPIVKQLGSKEVNNRFKETSIFYDLDIIVESNARKEAANYSLASRLLYHRYVLFSKEILKNYASYFQIDYLFVSGDINPRHSIQFFGNFYYTDFFLFALGIYYLLNKSKKENWLLFLWLLIGLFPAAISKTNPHALRTLPTLPVYLIVLTLGIVQIVKIAEKIQDAGFRMKDVIWFLLFCLYTLQFAAFYRYYSKIYPKVYAQEWQYGYEELVSQVNSAKLDHPNDQIYISREQGRPAMYYWFYSKTDPREVQKLNDLVKQDQGEYLEFENIKFQDPPIDSQLPLIFAAGPEFSESYCANQKTLKCNLLSVIKDLNSQAIWQIYELN